jgi:hypothetical protein
VRKVAADAEDYVYPSDVRVSNQNDLLYIKASGLAGGVNHETWLFEYDLRNQHLVTRERVSDEASVRSALKTQYPSDLTSDW